jgi:hypothetical protein
MPLVFETLHVREEGAVLFVEIAAYTFCHTSDIE